MCRLTSHEYARGLQAIADLLLSRPCFMTEYKDTRESLYVWDYENMKPCLEALKPFELEDNKGDDTYITLTVTINATTSVIVKLYRRDACEGQPATWIVKDEIKELVTSARGGQ